MVILSLDDFGPVDENLPDVGGDETVVQAKPQAFVAPFGNREGGSTPSPAPLQDGQTTASIHSEASSNPLGWDDFGPDIPIEAPSAEGRSPVEQSVEVPKQFMQPAIEGSSGAFQIPGQYKGDAFEGVPVDEDKLYNESLPEIALGVGEAGVGVLAGTVAWIPAMIAKFGQVGHHSFVRSIAEDIVAGKGPPQDERQSQEERDKLITDAKAYLANADSPEALRERGRKSEELLSTYFGALPDPTTETGKMIMNKVGEVIHTITGPARRIAELIPEDEYPNLKDFVQFIGEAATFAAIGKVGGLGKRKIKRINELIKKKDFKKADKIASNALQKMSKDKKLNTPEFKAALERQREIEATEAIGTIAEGLPKPKPKAPLENLTPEQRQQIINESFPRELPVERKVEPPKGTIDISTPEKRMMIIDQLYGEQLTKSQRDMISLMKEKLGTVAEKAPEPPKDVVPEAPIRTTPEVNQKILDRLYAETPESKRQNFLDAVQESDLGTIQTPESIAAKKAKVGQDNIARAVIQAKRNLSALVKPLKGERGSFDFSHSRKGAKDLKDVYGKAPKGMSLYNRLLKEGLSADDLNMAGVTKYLYEKGEKPIDWRELSKVMQENSIELKKHQSGEEFDLYGPDIHPELNMSGKMTDYKETLYEYKPITGEGFRESHWPYSDTESFGKNNIMAHRRSHQRELTTGEKILHIDEIQSKWHDEGRVLGFKKPIGTKGWTAIFTGEKNPRGRSIYEVRDASGNVVHTGAKARPGHYNEKNLISYAKQTLAGKGPMNAPYKKSWHKMVLRDALKEAIETGQEGVSWTTAEMQAKRYKDAPKGEATFSDMYDKRIGEFFKSEYGVTPVKKTTGANEVWYVPITKKMRSIYEGTPEGVALKPMHPLSRLLKEERGSLSFKDLSSEESTTLNNLMKDAKLRGLTLREHLQEEGLNKREIKSIAKLVNEAKQVKLKSLEKVDPFNPINETKVNISKGSKDTIFVGDKFMEALQFSPKLTGGVKALKTAPYVFDTLPAPLKKIYYKWVDNNYARFQAKKSLQEHAKQLVKEFPNAKLRKEVTVKSHSRTKSGLNALAKHKEMPITDAIAYDAMEVATEKIFKNLYDQLNEVRVAAGEKPLPLIQELTGGEHRYMPFFAKENFFDKIADTIKGANTMDKGNLILDRVEAIKHRHDPKAVNATMLRHTKRGKLRKGVRLEFDPVNLLARYGDAALDHIYMTPITSFIREITSQRLKNPKTGEHYDMRVDNPSMGSFLKTWSNAVAGVDNFNLPKSLGFIEKGTRGLSKNLSAATLNFNLRTMLVQFTALLPTVTEFGYLPTAKGLAEFTFAGVKKAPGKLFGHEIKGKDPVRLSKVLEPRVFDTFLTDSVNVIAGNKFQKTKQLYNKAGTAGMKALDYVAAEATWRTAFNSVKKKMSEGEAARFADDAVTRTQGSGARGDLSPLQLNVMGKAASLWQTYTINHINFIARDVLGIKNPKLSKIDVAKRVGRYVIGSALISSLFQEGMGIQSPQPSPIDTIIKGLDEGDHKAVIALKTLLESAELFPVVGGLKYGSTPMGPVAGYVHDFYKAVSGNDVFTKDLLPKALDGDKKAMQRLSLFMVEFGGKGLGVRWTGQAVKTVKGLRRGESLPGALIGKYQEKPKKSNDDFTFDDF